MTSFLDKIGLQRLWDAITSLFATKTEVAARTTARIYYGTCSTTASYVAKVATTETFPTVAYDDNGTTKYKPESGTVVGIKYTVSNTYKTAGSTHTLEVNSTGAWPMYYNNAELATTTSANTLVAGYKNRYVFYMFNGTQWVFLSASYDANSTYSDMTQAEITAGTGTTGRKITPKMLRDNFYTEDEVDDALALKANSADLATVATSGSYNDLDDTPTIPAAVTETTVSNWGFTKNTGTVTGVKMNDTTKGTSGLVDLGTVLTEHQDISGKADVAALAGYTPTANFATINGASITGGGDIIITAGSSSITTIDAVPTKNSTNPVQSGGVYDAIEGGFYY